MERVSTGIKGLDEMIEGGFKKNNSIMLVGGCGTGKSTMSMQYLYNGALRGEPGIYVTFEEDPEQIKENMMVFDFDIDKMERAGMLKLMKVKPEDVLHIVRGEYGAINDAVNALKAKRVVIDSITSIEMMIDGDFETRTSLVKFMNWLRSSKCTSIMIAEYEQDPVRYFRNGVLDSIVDGVIVLYNFRRGKSRVRALEVLKMRGTNHMANLVPYIIDKGITLQPNQMVFGDFDDKQG
jgi:circadian clock protein KaiC